MEKDADPKKTQSVPLFEKIADRLGICLSALCVVHCVLTPVILLLLPSVQFFHFFTTHETFHMLMLMVLPMLALLAFIPGFRLHGDKRVFLWAIPGIASIAAGALLFEGNAEGNAWFEAGFSIAGSCMLIRAHFLNRVLCSCCETGHGKFAFGLGSNGGSAGDFKRFRATKNLRKARLLSAPRGGKR